MKNVKYILINETDSENAARIIDNCRLPEIGRHLIIKTEPLSAMGVNGKAERLIEQIGSVRKQYPNALIFGVGELGDYCVHPSKVMNDIRRALSLQDVNRQI